MRWFKKMAAILLLLWGVPLSIWSLSDTLNPNLSAEEKEGALPALMFFGLPPIAISGLLLHNLRRQQQVLIKEREQALDRLFLQELQIHNGIINPIVFATKAQLTLDETKAFLDEKAIQLNALYDVSETGGVVYRFPF